MFYLKSMMNNPSTNKLVTSFEATSLEKDNGNDNVSISYLNVILLILEQNHTNAMRGRLCKGSLMLGKSCIWFLH